MLVGRRRKIAIVAAILIAGTGIALLFRHEERRDTSSTAVGAPSAAPKGSAAAFQPAGQDASAKLAGHIEPAAGLSNNAESTAAKAVAPYKSPLESTGSFPLTEPAGREPSARFAADTVESPLKWQSVRRPAPAMSESDIEREPSNIATPDARSPERRHRIVDGDTLAALAHRYLGSEERQLDLLAYNRDILTNPELLPIGKELRIPPADFVSPPTSTQFPGASHGVLSPTIEQSPPAPVSSNVSPPSNVTRRESEIRTYVVQQHDTLALIARRFYGDIRHQGELLTANRQQLRSAKDLRPGMKLIVPAAKSPQ
jgi:nucleoid-associated protein YgaU